MEGESDEEQTLPAEEDQFLKSKCEQKDLGLFSSSKKGRWAKISDF
jgi:hypothetical protein